MTDVFTRDERSRIMSRIRSRGNESTELRFIRILRKHKITGWRRGSVLPGKPDFVFKGARVVVFVDGDFWHGNPRKFRVPKSNVDYWAPKIEATRRRDATNNRQLRKLGWRVLRFWESGLRKERAVAAKIKRALGLWLLRAEPSVIRRSRGNLVDGGR
jgi:DNA mismatch endonuclease (patch repair protein)